MRVIVVTKKHQTPNRLQQGRANTFSALDGVESNLSPLMPQRKSRGKIIVLTKKSEPEKH